MNPDLRCIVCDEYFSTLYIVGGVPFCEKHYKSEIVSHAIAVKSRVMESRRRRTLKKE